MHYFLRSLGGVRRVQEGKKLAELNVPLIAANGGYVVSLGRAAWSCIVNVIDVTCSTVITDVESSICDVSDDM